FVEQLFFRPKDAGAIAFMDASGVEAQSYFARHQGTLHGINGTSRPGYLLQVSHQEPFEYVPTWELHTTATAVEGFLRRLGSPTSNSFIEIEKLIMNASPSPQVRATFQSILTGQPFFEALENAYQEMGYKVFRERKQENVPILDDALDSFQTRNPSAQQAKSPARSARASRHAVTGQRGSSRYPPSEPRPVPREFLETLTTAEEAALRAAVLLPRDDLFQPRGAAGAWTSK